MVVQPAPTTSNVSDRLIAALFAVLAAAASAGGAERPVAWVELGADGALSVRAAAPPGTACPQVSADGVAVASIPRGAPDGAFPLQILSLIHI